MDKLLESIPLLSTDELNILLNKVRNAINEKATKLEIENIISNVNNDGFYCCKSGPFITGFSTIELPMNVLVYTKDRVDLEDWHVIDYKDAKQRPWVERLGYDDFINDDDEFEINPDKSSYDYGDWDSAVTAAATMNITVYYRQDANPPKRSEFDSIDENGNILKWEIRNKGMYCDGEFIDHVSEWNDYAIFVAPERSV